MNSIDENDKNESDVNPGQLVPVSNCHLQNSTACMPLTPRTESVTSSSNFNKVFRNLWKIYFVPHHMFFAINTAVIF
jgi:hypothetical protein